MNHRSGIIPKNVVVVLNNSALGDTVCTLPAILNLHKHGSLVKVFTSEFFAELYGLFLPEDKYQVFDVLTEKVVATGAMVRATYVNFITSIQTHLVDYSSLVLSDTILKDRSYPKAPQFSQSFVSGDYALISTNHTSDLKGLPTKSIESIIDHFCDLGITPVLVGKHYRAKNGDSDLEVKSYGIKSNKALDLRDKTSLKDLIALCQSARVLVSMDGGLVHLAGLTDVKIVCGYSHKDPHYLMPIRDNQLGKDVWAVTPPPTSCRFCMTEIILPDQNFAFCARKDLECIQHMNSANFIDAIDEALA